MKVVFIASRSLDKIGGIETYMKYLTPELVKRGYEVILYTDGGWFHKSTYKGVTVIALPIIKGKMVTKVLLGFIATVHSIIFNRNVDIYHYNADAAALFSFFPKLLNKNVVYQGHGLEWKRAKWSPFAQKIIHYLDDFVMGINNNITMVSQEQSDYVMSRYNKMAHTITSGVDIRLETFNTSILNKYKIIQNNYILYLGRLVPEKKADILIEGFIKANNQNLQLIIAGDDANEKQYIENLKNMARGHKNIIFTGAVFNDDKEALLQNCKVFCIPSELEGLPITLLEAMSYGKICLASDIEANKEALATCGIYFNVNNSDDLATKLFNIMSQFDENKLLGTMAKQRVENNFTWDIIANKFDKYYQSLL